MLEGACKAFRSSAVACPILLRRLLVCSSNPMCQVLWNSHCTDVAAKQSKRAGVSWSAAPKHNPDCGKRMGGEGKGGERKERSTPPKRVAVVWVSQQSPRGAPSICISQAFKIRPAHASNHVISNLAGILPWEARPRSFLVMMPTTNPRGSTTAR